MGDIEESEKIKKDFLLELKKEYTDESIISTLSSLKNLKVLIIGDTIIDEYVYCDSLGRAKKEPVLVFKHNYLEQYAGGILAIANHVAEFSDNITLLTHLGNDALIEEIISKNLNKKIINKFFKDQVYPTLTKRRYVYAYRLSKILEVYNKDPEAIKLAEDEIMKYIEEYSNSFDLTIIGDFGHGLITDKIKEVICKKAKFLAVNVQANSGNFGYNLITKFNRADYISLTAEELQLAMRDKNSDLKELIKKLSLQTKCKKICITLGKKGILYFDNWIFYRVPILSNKVIDTVGAGDAVFSITSMVANKDIDPKLVPFIGNCAGALAVQIIGNKEPVRSENLKNFISSLFA